MTVYTLYTLYSVTPPGKTFAKEAAAARMLEAAALQWPMPEGMPWDRGLFTQQLVLDLFERQLQQWEVEHGG